MAVGESMEVRIATLQAVVTALQSNVERALDLAIQAKIEVEAMKKSTHRVEYVNPWMMQNQEGGEALPQSVQEEEAPAPPILSERRVSPFSPVVREAVRKDQVSDESVDSDAAALHELL